MNLQNALCLALGLISSNAAMAFSDYGTHSLIIGEYKGDRLQFSCSGNLIGNEHWIITAGHCVEPYKKGDHVVFRSADRVTEYTAKRAYWINEQMNSSALSKNFVNELVNRYDFALVEVEKTQGPPPSKEVPQALSFDQLSSLQPSNTDFISTKIRSIEDLFEVEKFAGKSLLSSAETAKLMGHGDSGSAVMTVDKKIVAITTDIFSYGITIGFWNALKSGDTPHVRAVLIPYAVCTVGPKAFEAKDQAASLEHPNQSAWLENYLATCPAKILSELPKHSVNLTEF